MILARLENVDSRFERIMSTKLTFELFNSAAWPKEKVTIGV